MKKYLLDRVAIRDRIRPDGSELGSQKCYSSSTCQISLLLRGSRLSEHPPLRTALEQLSPAVDSRWRPSLLPRRSNVLGRRQPTTAFTFYERALHSIAYIKPSQHHPCMLYLDRYSHYGPIVLPRSQGLFRGIYALQKAEAPDPLRIARGRLPPHVQVGNLTEHAPS